jgi:hypothetical protein
MVHTVVGARLPAKSPSDDENVLGDRVSQASVLLAA